MSFTTASTCPDTLSFLSILATTSKLIFSAKSISHLFLNGELLVEVFSGLFKTRVEKFALTHVVTHMWLQSLQNFRNSNFNDVYTLLTSFSIYFKQRVMLITLLAIW